MQLDLFAPPGTARTTDPATAHGAAIIAIGNKATNQQIALAALYHAGSGGLTDFDLAAATGIGQTSIGKRRGELRDAGLVCAAFLLDPATGERISVRRPSPTGTPAQVWEITPAGREGYEARP